MNIQSLTSGLVLKSYKDLCVALEVPIKTGKSKQIQLEDFSRYFTYTKDKYKYIITILEIHHIHLTPYTLH